MWDLPFFPEQASTFASQTDLLFLVLIGLALLFAVPVAALIIYFAIRYRSSADVDRSGHIPNALALEIGWIVVPTVLALGIFGWGARLYFNIYNLPDEGLDIYVVGKQWMWKAQHPTGQREVNELHVPVNTPVRLTMISQDVIHSFYIPDFRVKRDVVPGLYTTFWFEATRTGEYALYCTEYCGTEHSAMIGQIVVLEGSEYQNWLQERPVDDSPDDLNEGNMGREMEQDSGSIPGESEEEEGDSMDEGVQHVAPMAATGAMLLAQKGCTDCHGAEDGERAPGLAGIYGRAVRLASGERVTVDAQYIRDAVFEPNRQVVAGYKPNMPTYRGQIDEEEMLYLVEYIKSLADGTPASADEASALLSHSPSSLFSEGADR